MRKTGLPGILCLAMASAAAAGSPPPARPVPVMVGGNSEMDACGSLMRIAFRTRAPGNFAAVRAAPSTSAAERQRLFTGQRVLACQTVGEWTGIVYRTPGDGNDDDISACGVSSPIARRRAYIGPCASGWVASRLLALEAG